MRLRVWVMMELRVSEGDLVRNAEAEDVTEDSPDAGRRPLERLHRARMVVGLDLERDHRPVAQAYGTRVLPRPDDDSLPLRRQAAQDLARVLVAAVLGPEQREHRELEVVRSTLEARLDLLEFTVGETERSMEWLLERRGQPRRID